MIAGSPRRRSSMVLVGLIAVMVAAAVSACGRPAFEPYTPTAEMVPPLAESSSIRLGGPYAPELWTSCEARALRQIDDPGPDGSEWRAVSQKLSTPDERTRVVSFATRRFGSRGDFDEQWSQVEDWFREPCLDDDNPSNVDVEPHPLDGLPDGAVTARWPLKSEESWSTVIGDRDRQLMMVVIWTESPGAVPTDTFVNLANSAWTEFLTNNS